MISGKKMLLIALISSLAIGISWIVKTNNTTRAFSESTRQMEEKVREQNERQAKELFASAQAKAMAGFRSFSYDLYADALRDVEKAIELDPKNAQLHYYAANLKPKLGDLDGMIESFNKAIEIVQEQGNVELANSLEDEKRRFTKSFAELQKF
jgi:Tfp pilus assembly protein PilF